MNLSSALATVLVDELVRCGVTDAVLAPGSRSAPLALALHAEQRVRLHVRIDERSAAFLALGLGRVTGRPAVVVTTSGTAAANLHPAVLEADVARVPLLVLTADRPPELRGTGANQTIDQIKLYGSGVRWFCEVGVPEAVPGAVAYWRSTADRAYAAATGGPPGPVHCNLAFREPLVPTGEEPFVEALDGHPGGRAWTEVSERAGQPAEAVVERLSTRLTGVQRGLLVAGDTCADPAPLLALADALGWPLLAEPQSGARSGPQAIGAYDLLLRSPAFTASHRPDLVLTVGKLGLSKSLLAFLDADVPQVLVEELGSWPDPSRTVAQVLRADPAALFTALAERVAGGDRDWLEDWRRADAAARAAVDEILDAETAPSEPRLARDLAALAVDGTALTVASSMPVRDLATFMAPRPGLRVLANRGASGIDGFVSTAVGVALGQAGPSLALAGDLSLLHDQNGLFTGEPAPDLPLVAINNDGGGIFSFLPQAERSERFERLFGTPHGVDLARVAAAANVGHTRLERASDLAAALADAAAAGGIHLIEARTDRTTNAHLHHRLTQAALAAITARR